MANYSVGDLSRREILKMSAVLAGSVETPDPRHVRFRLRQPWPDFLTFYVEATGAGWIVPRRYVERVGDEGYKKAPVGAGPYRFVSFIPGQELTLEAFDQYWRKTPNVKRLMFRVIPDVDRQGDAVEPDDAGYAKAAQRIDGGDAPDCGRRRRDRACAAIVGVQPIVIVRASPGSRRV